MSTKSIVYLVLLALLVFWTVGAYNRLVRLKNAVAREFASVDAQLRLRHEQLAQLLQMTGPRWTEQSVSGVSQGLTRAVSACEAARAKPSDGPTAAALDEAERSLDEQLALLWRQPVAREAFHTDPGLRLVTDELKLIEGKLGFVAEPFNRAVQAFNEAQSEFPTVLIARIFGFWTLTPLRLSENSASRDALRLLA